MRKALDRTIGFRLAAVPAVEAGLAADRPADRDRSRVPSGTHVAGDVLSVRVAGVSFNLCWCPLGSFSMPTEDSSGGGTRMVSIPDGFWMGETEVTQQLWSRVMDGGNPSYNKPGASNPVENVTWSECARFVERLNEIPGMQPAGLRFAFPTEAQWEYACRAESKGDFGGTKSSPDGFADMGWHSSNSGKETHPVKRRMPNRWGLYDMHGNVWEWCADRCRITPDGSTDNDAAVEEWADLRVLRGGSGRDDADDCRSSSRKGNSPGGRIRWHGLRIMAFPDEG